MSAHPSTTPAGVGLTSTYGLAKLLDERFAGRRTAYARRGQNKKGDWEYWPARPRKDGPLLPLTVDTFERHLSGRDEDAIGVYLLDDGGSDVRFAAIDIDNGHGDNPALPWADLVKLVQPLHKLLNTISDVLAVRSGGGQGIHLVLFFERPVAAAAVRKHLLWVLGQCGLRVDATSSGGIRDGVVEVFPKQDHCRSGKGFANLIAVPFARQSVPLDDNLEPLSIDTALERLGAVPFYIVPEPVRSTSTYDLRSADNVVVPFRPAGRKPFDVEAAMKGVGEGSRDQTLWSLASRLRADDIPQDEAERMVLEAAANCEPPMEKAVAIDKVRRAYSLYPPNKKTADGGHPRRVVNHAAAMAVLRSDPKLRDLIGFDEMQRTEVLMRPVPGSRYHLDGMQELRDHDVAALLEYLQHNGMERLPLETLWKAVSLRARECAFHPIKQYLNGLSWDGVERLPTWLSTYLGTEDSDYTRTIGRLFMIALVARVMDPGCKADYMMILEGVQSATKSTACGILGGEWFSDQLPDVRGDKDASQHLKGKWLIEVSELSSMSKADTNALKAFITRSTERYRPSYARKEVSEPRQCLFIGTTNKAAYLKDETGGRRFWPVKVADRINLNGLRAARDQLFAEALARYKRKEQWWPDRDVEVSVIQPQQEARYEGDIWEEQVENGLRETGRDRLTLLDVAVDLVGLQPDRVGTGTTRRLSAIMERLKWERSPKKGSKGERWWVPGPGWSGKKLTDSAGDRPAFRPPATVTDRKIENAF